MRIGGKAIADIINRLYTIEQDGAKVINPKLLAELQSIIMNRYNNGGYKVVSGPSYDILQIYSSGKYGSKMIFSRKIGKSKDAVPSSDTAPTKTTTENHFDEATDVRRKAAKKLDYEGLDNKENAARPCDAKDFPKDIYIKPIKEYGNLYFFSKSNSADGHFSLYGLYTEKITGSGVCKCPQVQRSHYVNGANSIIDAANDIFNAYPELQVDDNDFKINFEGINEKEMPLQLYLPVAVSLYLSAAQKYFPDDTAILSFDFKNAAVPISFSDLAEIFAKCSRSRVKILLLPVSCKNAIANMDMYIPWPALIFYTSLEDAIVKSVADRTPI